MLWDSGCSLIDSSRIFFFSCFFSLFFLLPPFSLSCNPTPPTPFTTSIFLALALAWTAVAYCLSSDCVLIYTSRLRLVERVSFFFVYRWTDTRAHHTLLLSHHDRLSDQELTVDDVTELYSVTA
jgi:hypothetical protein